MRDKFRDTTDRRIERIVLKSFRVVEREISTEGAGQRETQ